MQAQIKALGMEYVSIHAPARGATDPRRRRPGCCVLFQSTRPRGARRRSDFGLDCGLTCFNPRAREGRD